MIPEGREAATKGRINLRGIFRSLASVLPLLAIASMCRADLLSEGRDLYKAGNYPEAVKKLEAATKADPANAKAWWQLNFAYNKLSRFDDALRAARMAGQLDASRSFASEPGKYDETIRRLEGKASVSGKMTASSRNALKPLANDGITKALLNGDVYVAPGMKADSARLQAVANELRPARVKFVVFASRSGASTLAAEADRIRKYLGLNDGYVIAASRAGVSAAGQGLSRDRLRESARAVAPRMEAGDYTAGLEALARSLVRQRAEAKAAAVIGWGSALGILVVIIVSFLIVRRMANATAMKRRLGTLDALKSSVLGRMNTLVDEALGLPPMAASRVQEARRSAGEKLDQASRLMSKGKNDRDLQRAEALLNQALLDIEGGQAIARRALSGEPEPVAAARKHGSIAEELASIPQSERGVCFFCSQPARLRELTPVTVSLGGEEKKVLACAADLQTIKTGQMPSIRAFERDGKRVPWFADDRYDPYRDYYDRGYDNRSLMSDLMTLSLIDNLFWSWGRPSWGWGWGSPYAFSYDHHYYHDWAHDRAAAASMPDLDAGGADFLGGGARFDSSVFSGGGADFLGGDHS